MSNEESIKPEAITFLQTLVTEVVEAAGQEGCKHCGGSDYIEKIGLTASDCLEGITRKQLGLVGKVNPDQYATIITKFKNTIGGNFSRASSEAGVIRVVNTRCPFGEVVKNAPELCKMTSSVFGGIAARNFGYAKVQLNKRIATNDGMCDVSIYLDPEIARDKPGNEYLSEEESIISQSAAASVTSRIEEKANKAWQKLGKSKTKKPFSSPIAESRAMRNILEAVEVVAPTVVTVLLSGETGVGKEVIARTVHALSDRCEQEFVSVNCGSIPESLIESTLFGHEKGAFTNAYNVHHGHFERAGGGTLFLDEIDSLPLSAQTRLLKVLQEGEYERVGGKGTLLADARIIAATNQDLEKLVDSGEFRKDLFYRLNVVPIFIPPLRERKDDILALVDHFLSKLSAKYDKPKKTLSERARINTFTHSWPGNARELENILERAFLFTNGTVIEDIYPISQSNISDTSSEKNASFREVKKKAADEAEIRFILDSLVTYQGNVSEVARSMGISRRAVHLKLKSHGIDANSYR